MEKQVTIQNKSGLHARPAAEFVKTASRFAAEISLVKDEKVVNAKSVIGVMSLAAAKGTTLTIRAEGPDAAEALDTLVKLIESRFGEE
ncbi:HPr family phosphocarrier protein [Brevibacillus marinus]|jgi:phosphotransferase system HPr (HPr) family protein|uniref:HPr family phosphocarrier protein n=1 Tax=Brevibacillus marinus TaxID=2496837 RepID=UPI000F84810C|nr:HPr family phosphocarrier protein [Brevibacillus marinus]